jgi:predicted DNA-binding WGR domain protein
VLHRIDPEQGVRRFCSLTIKCDLFGGGVLVRNWGRIGTSGQAPEIIVRAKRRRGYRDL